MIASLKRYLLALLKSWEAPARSVVINDFADVCDVGYASDRSSRPRAIIPMTHAVSLEACYYSHGWHHFICALAHGPEVLRWYSSFARPKSIFEAVGIGAPDQMTDASTVLPWSIRFDRGNVRKKPRPTADTEYAKLVSIRDSIRTNGFQPDAYGDILGQFLVRDKEYRFLVRSGKHRAAILGSLDAKTMPVRCRPERASLISRSSVDSWPAVARGHMSRADALRIFDSFFDQDGTQHFDRLSALAPCPTQWRQIR